MALLDVENLSIDFGVDGRKLPAVSELSFSIGKGEILALVGESGCGKSVTCLSLARLLPSPPAIINGKILFHDGNSRDPLEVLKLKPRELRKLRGGKIAYVFQEPSVSLNPVFRIGNQIEEAIRLHRPELRDTESEVIKLLKQVGIPAPETRINSYPHEMSGGMQQRVMIAMALASSPDLLIADEPTTALDVTIQSQILELLKELRDNTGMTIIIVTHNLGIVSEMADNVIVMYAGHSVESSSVKNVISSPIHPYTKALLSAVPEIGKSVENLCSIRGNVPTPSEFPRGCRFFGRCDLCDALSHEEKSLCETDVPVWREERPGHFCRCHHAGKSLEKGTLS
ncbi:MAG: dipeptide/oligopeptide/nickel ABC transporter ATP-binding protein [Lentisphaerae bacterium GWF2_45_14]|nr:MAG: dipeptide/oligopeptide/nickel ABC transporter ATP-binding protein [Lentisphaerae bacterium GWF2_45_14]